MRKRLLYVLLLVFCSALQAASPEDYRFFTELVPPEKEVTKQLNSVRLNNAVWTAISGLGDMRLYSAAGRELPFKSEQLFESGSTLRSEPVPCQVISFKLEGRKAVIFVRVGRDGKGARVDSLTIRTNERDFEKRVTISGRDNVAWHELVRESPFFDRNPRIALRRVSFHFSAGCYRVLRIEIDNYGEDYVSPLRRITEGETPENRKEEREVLFRELKIDGIDLSVKKSVNVSACAVEQSFEPEIRSVANDPETKCTVIEFDCRWIPMTRLELLSSSTNFSREATFETVDGTLKKHARLESLSIPGYTRRTTAISFGGEQRLGLCRITIRNGDNPPLETLTLKGYGPVYRLVTLAADIPAKLCYGGNGVAPGDYDLGRTLSGINTATLKFNEYQCGPQLDTPDFRESEEENSWLFSSKWIFPAATVLLALVLIVFIVRNIGLVEKSRNDN